MGYTGLMLREIVKVGGRIGLSLLITRGLVKPVTPVMPSESARVYDQSNSGRSYHFAELWSKYLDVQMQPGTPEGKVVDFFDYCTPHPKGCGFDSRDPDFDKKFHGHVSGYRANWIDGEWIYTKIK